MIVRVPSTSAAQNMNPNMPAVDPGSLRRDGLNIRTCALLQRVIEVHTFRERGPVLQPKAARQLGWRQWYRLQVTADMFIPTCGDCRRVGIWPGGHHRIGIVEDWRLGRIKPICAGLLIERHQPAIAGAQINGQARGMIVACGIIRQD